MFFSKATTIWVNMAVRLKFKKEATCRTRLLSENTRATEVLLLKLSFHGKEPFGVVVVPYMRRLSFICTLKVLCVCPGLRHSEAWGHEKRSYPLGHLNMPVFCFLSEPLGLSGIFTLVQWYT